MIGRTLNTARTVGLKGGIIMFSNPVQQFLEDNDLYPGEKFHILNSSHENLCDKTFYINKDFKEPEDILKCDGEKNGHAYTFLALLTGKFSVKKKSFHPQNGDIYYYVTALGEIEKVLFFNDANTLHCLLRKAGKCYRTRDEAEKHLIDDYKKLREM
mgnify:CR=1 FL=1